MAVINDDIVVEMLVILVVENENLMKMIYLRVPIIGNEEVDEKELAIVSYDWVDKEDINYVLFGNCRGGSDKVDYVERNLVVKKGTLREDINLLLLIITKTVDYTRY